MAGVHCTVFSLLTPSYEPNTRRTFALPVVSSIPTPNPSRIRHRKNYLRHKILKTLNEPFELITPLLSQESPPQSSASILSPQYPEEHDICVEITADKTHTTSGESDSSEKLPASETTGEHHGVTGKLSARPILKYGAYFVGVFALQTICSVWILCNDSSKQKGEGSEISGRGKRSLLINWIGKTRRAANASNVAYEKDQLQLETKIEKIKLMASEARKIKENKKGEVRDPEW